MKPREQISRSKQDKIQSPYISNALHEPEAQAKPVRRFPQVHFFWRIRYLFWDINNRKPINRFSLWFNSCVLSLKTKYLVACFQFLTLSIFPICWRSKIFFQVVQRKTFVCSLFKLFKVITRLCFDLAYICSLVILNIIQYVAFILYGY